MKRTTLRRLGILGSPDGPYVKQLTAAARARHANINVCSLSFADLSVMLAANGQARVTTTRSLSTDHSSASSSIAAGHSNRVELCDLDGLIVRSMPLGSLEQVIFRMDALQVVESAGVPLVNPPRALEVAIDKWLTLQRLAKAGIATPTTLVCQTRDSALAAFETLGRDVVVKPLFGGEGRGLVRVTDSDMAWRVFSTLEQIRSVIYIQPFIQNFGYDIRVLLVGSQVLSIKRRAASGAWRTNISQGSRAEPHELSESELQMARAAANTVGGTFLGIDLMPTTVGDCVVLEVNAVPGWNGTQGALGVDVADLVIAHIEELHVDRHSK